MGKKIVWATDLHLNFINECKFNDLVSRIKKESADMFLIGGDIGESLNVEDYLRLLGSELNLPIFFVLGNHDFFGSSIDKVRAKSKSFSNNSDFLFYLDDMPYVELSKDTALIGHSGWADGRFGDYLSSNVRLNNDVLIKDFVGLNKFQKLTKLKKLGDESASKLYVSMKKVISQYKNIICLTHIPPFKESCRYRGEVSDDNYLPHFSCKVVGDVLKQIMLKNPDNNLKVLCGHTHGAGQVKILDNLEVITAGAKYYEPCIQLPIYI